MDNTSSKNSNDDLPTDQMIQQLTYIIPTVQSINGVHISNFWNHADIKSAMRYQARPDDVFISTYPKSGTTWMQAIIYTLLTGGQAFNSDWFDFETKTPFLEVVGSKGVQQMRRPGTIKTHMPFYCIPYHPIAKYICVLRNPKDVCMSYYRFYTVGCENDADIPSFNQFFSLFIQGCVDFGDYYNHLQLVWSQKDNHNVIIFLYEDMQSDLPAIIRRLSDFLEIPLNSELLECVIRYCSLAYMKEKYDRERFYFYAYSKRYKHTPQAFLLQKQASFEASPELTSPVVPHKIRNGIVGEGSNYMTQEQIYHMDAKLRETMHGTGFLEYLSETHAKEWLSSE